jgi:hypothetical protein
MTTAATIDRIVHHAVILERTGLSFRAEAAKARLPKEAEPPPNGTLLGWQQARRASSAQPYLEAST